MAQLWLVDLTQITDALLAQGLQRVVDTTIRSPQHPIVIDNDLFRALLAAYPNIADGDLVELRTGGGFSFELIRTGNRLVPAWQYDLIVQDFVLPVMAPTQFAPAHWVNVLGSSNYLFYLPPLQAVDPQQLLELDGWLVYPAGGGWYFVFTDEDQLVDYPLSQHHVGKIQDEPIPGIPAGHAIRVVA